MNGHQAWLEAPYVAEAELSEADERAREKGFADAEEYDAFLEDEAVDRAIDEARDREDDRSWDDGDRDTDDDSFVEHYASEVA